MKENMEGIKIGMSGKMDEIAKQFMEENGYKMTRLGKNQAINDLEAIDDCEYDTEFITALKTAIATLPVEGE